MEQFNLVRRRTSDLLKEAQQSIPSKLPSKLPQFQLPQLPSIGSFNINAPRVDNMKGTWEQIDAPVLPRSAHSLNVISGSAYIFGGSNQSDGLVEDNDIHVVTLPDITGFSDAFNIKAVADTRHHQTAEALHAAQNAEWQEKMREELKEKGLQDVPLETDAKGKGKETATGETALGDVPSPRAGHATAVIGSRIFIFGGRGGSDLKPLEEKGRVWIFDTRSRLWTYLDPVPAVKGGAIIPHPAPRSNHSATSLDRPQDFGKPPAKKAETWQEWAVGDISKTGLPQDPVVGYVAEEAIDEEFAGYGTFIVHGGTLASGDQASDSWAFDVRSRTWTELPAAPGPARSNTAICVSKSRLYRFGGYDGEHELGGQLDFIQLEVELFNDGHTKGEVAVRARGGWQSVIQNNPDASSTDIPVEPNQEWPQARSAALFTSINLGGGREYLVLAMGESQGPTSNKFHGDVWTFQAPPQGMSTASFTDAILQAAGRKTSEGKWIKVELRPYDLERNRRLPMRRGLMAAAPMGDMDESGIVMWGGVGERGEKLGDGWILRLE